MRVFESAGGAEKSKTMKSIPEEERHSPLPGFFIYRSAALTGDSTRPSAVSVQFFEKTALKKRLLHQAFSSFSAISAVFSTLFVFLNRSDLYSHPPFLII